MLNGIYIVGITGKAGSGKDTLAKMIVDGNEGVFTTASFASALRDVAKVLFGTRIETQEEKAKTFNNGMTGRQILQTLGENLRRDFSQDIWINALVEDISRNVKKKVVIITDVRYPNEAVICDEVWKIQRGESILTGVEARHESEIHIDKIKYNYLVENKSSLDCLEETAKMLRRRLLLWVGEKTEW